jgi:hypothetical protein
MEAAMFSLHRFFKLVYILALGTGVVVLSRPSPARAQRAIAYPFLPNATSTAFAMASLNATAATPLTSYQQAMSMLSLAGIPPSSSGIGAGAFGQAGVGFGAFGQAGVGPAGFGLGGFNGFGLTGFNGFGLAGVNGFGLGGFNGLGFGNFTGLNVGPVANVGGGFNGLGLNAFGVGGFAGKGFGGFNGKKAR